MRETEGPGVCVVDDNEGIRASLRILLEEAGYEVQVAMDGVAAPALICAEARPRVLLLDGMMPHAGGAKTLRQVGELPEDARRGTAIVFMAAGNDPPASDIAGRIQRHALATVAKPFDLDALLAAVERGAIQLARRSEKG